MLVLIKGAGDLATGVALRLHRSRIQVVMTDIERPTAVRRTVAFCQCVYDGVHTVEGVAARRAAGVESVRTALAAGEIPVVVDPAAEILDKLPFDALVDAILAKKNLGTRLTDAPVVLALGPGFTAGADCHGVVETMRGHDLGRLILEGPAKPNTGVPGDVAGFSKERLIRASADGTFHPLRAIGDLVEKGDVVATVDGVPVLANMSGMVRGMLPDGLFVKTGMKAGDVDARTVREHCFTVSDKARAIGGGVLEGLLHFGAGASREGDAGRGPRPCLP